MNTITSYCKNKLNLDTIELGSEFFYSCLPLAIIDAVFSIQLTYTKVQQVVNAYCKEYSIAMHKNDGGSVHTVSNLISNIVSHEIDDFAENVLHSKNKTTGRNPILKVEAVYQWAKILQANGIETFEDLKKVDTDSLQNELKTIQGQGEATIKYFFMLCGNDNECKPDRHLLRFLSTVLGADIKSVDAQKIMSDITEELKQEHSNLTVRLLDYAIWQYQKDNIYHKYEINK